MFKEVKNKLKEPMDILYTLKVLLNYKLMKLRTIWNGFQIQKVLNKDVLEEKNGTFDPWEVLSLVLRFSLVSFYIGYLLVWSMTILCIVWEMVSRPENKSLVGSRWIYKMKDATDGSIEK